MLADSLFTRSRLAELQKKSNLLIAVFHQGGIGSGLLMGPMLQILRNQRPQAQISFFSYQEQDGDFLKEAGLVDFSCKILPGVHTVIPGEFDLLLSAARTCEGSLQAKRFSAKLKIGFFIHIGWHRLSRLYHHLAINVPQKQHEAQSDALLLEPLFQVVPSIPTHVLPDTSALFKRYPKESSGRPTRIVIHPGCSRHLEWKRYPVQKFAEAIRSVRSRVACEVEIICGPEEQVESELLLSLLGDGTRIYRTTGKLSDTFQLLRSADCLIANDGAMMHLAAAARCPVAAIFGPTDPLVCGAWGDSKKIAVVHEAMPCSPCYEFYSGKLRCINASYLDCLKKIEPRMIEEAVMKLLENS